MPTWSEMCSSNRRVPGSVATTMTLLPARDHQRLQLALCGGGQDPPGERPVRRIHGRPLRPVGATDASPWTARNYGEHGSSRQRFEVVPAVHPLVEAISQECDADPERESHEQRKSNGP